MLGATAGLSGAGAQEPNKPAQNPIVLHVDLSVDPAKEREMLHNFHTIFKPAATKFPGYIDVKMCKLRSALQGTPPEGVNYRFQLTYQSEELRQKWVASETLKSKNYVVLLFDSM
jgi:antibiotic biosynthesis monooxygenase (ABM) superfamily enzyme